MNENKLEKIVEDIIRLIGKAITLRPIFNRWFSFKGLAITWGIIQIYWIIANFLNIYGIDYYDMLDFRVVEVFALILGQIEMLIELGLLFYLFGVYKYFRNDNNKKLLDYSKAVGVIDDSEYAKKLMDYRRNEYIFNVERLYDAGVFPKAYKNELIKIAEERYLNGDAGIVKDENSG